ncbi:MAG: serine hydrolase domain-containing protein, partial [Cyclobacteriaceae bacterium]
NLDFSTSHSYDIYCVSLRSKYKHTSSFGCLITAATVTFSADPKVDSKYSDQITIEQLLTHTSGLPSVSHPDVYKYLNPDLSEDALQKHIRSLASLKLTDKPSKKYSYSNVGYEVLGEVIANVSGQMFESFMATYIFQPLLMNELTYTPGIAHDLSVALPFSGHPPVRTEQFANDRRFTPSGNLFTNAEVLNHWMIFHLNKGFFGDYRPLSPQSFDRYVAPLVDTREDGYKSYGWFTKDTSGGNMLFHDGLDMGYSSLIVMLTKPKIGIVILTNQQDADCNELLNLIIRNIRF